MIFTDETADFRRAYPVDNPYASNNLRGLPQRKGTLFNVLTKKAYQNVLVCLIIEQISVQRKELNYGKIINWINRVFN